MACPFCPEGEPDPACVVCSGTGGWPLMRCPYVFTSYVDRKVVTCASLVDISVLPAPGGWQDQTAWFQQAAMLALSEKRDSEKRKSDSDTRKAESDARRAALNRGN